MKKLYGIGVGPGDPDLLTIKAKKIINTVDVLLCPVKSIGGKSFAYEIIESHLENKKVKIIEVVYPMHYDKNLLEDDWKRNGKLITEFINAGKSCGFITLGDPTLYSTFMYTLDKIRIDKNDVEIIPGITSFSAVASQLKESLVRWDESLKILPIGRENTESLVKKIQGEDNVILMKPKKDSAVLLETLKTLGLENNFKMITKVGRDSMKVTKDIQSLEQEDIPYLSTIFIKKGGFHD